jgi:hypothetical protein
MLTYIISGSNQYTIRTEPSASSNFTMSLQDMTTQVNTTASLSGVTYNSYESMLSFTASIANASVGQEFRITLLNSGSVEPIWHGTMQVYESQVVDKPAYKTQNNQYISHDTTNEFIIM